MIRVEPATEAQLAALVEGDSVFAERFGIEIVPGWCGFPEAVSAGLEALRAGAPAEWGTHLFFDADGALVGFGGWKGPPAGGEAELGYEVAPSRQRRGIATAVVRELIARARVAGVRTVVARTLPEESASTAVLRRCGFTLAGEAVDDDEGAVWRWELPLGDPA